MKQLDIQALPAETWRPVEAANGRVSNRVNELELERVPAWIVLSKGREFKVTLWDFSLHGFAVLQSTDALERDKLSLGDHVRVRLLAGAVPLEADCRVANISMHKGKNRIGLARRDLDRRVGPESRSFTPQGELLRISADIDLIAESDNPLFYGERSQLRLCGLGTGLRFDFLTTDSAHPWFRRQKLGLHLLIPTTGECRMAGRIESLEMVPGGALKVRVRAEGLDAGLANDLAEFLAYENGFSPEILKRLGFPIRIFRQRIEFRFVESKDDYAKVLALRRNAYVEVGKRATGTRAEAMSLGWDNRSRIFCAYYQGTLVASAALTFPTSDSDVMRSESAFPGNRFPGNPPPRSHVMEINCLCTDKDYRRGDLLRSFFEQIARIFVLSERDFMINLSDATLLPLYLGIGFRDQGHIGHLNGIPHHLIMGSKEVVTRSRGIGWLRWNILYGEVMRDLVSKRLVELPAGAMVGLAFRLA